MGLKLTFWAKSGCRSSARIPNVFSRLKSSSQDPSTLIYQRQMLEKMNTRTQITICNSLNFELHLICFFILLPINLSPSGSLSRKKVISGPNSDLENFGKINLQSFNCSLERFLMSRFVFGRLKKPPGGDFEQSLLVLKIFWTF